MTVSSSKNNKTVDASIKEVLELGIKSGSEAAIKGDYETAKDIFKSLLKLDPENASVKNQLGVIYGVQQNYDTAEKFLRTAVNKEPNDAEYRKNFGLILANQKRFKRALRELKKSFELNPNNFDMLYSIATVYREQNDEVEYERYLNLLLDHDPKDFRANNDLGILCAMRNDYKAALDYFIAVTDIQGAPSESYNHLGTVYAALGELEKSKLAFSTGVNLDSKNYDCLINLAVAERNLGNLDEALIQAETAILIDGNEAALNVLGTIQKEKGEFEAAYKTFEKALRRNENFAPAIINRGFINLRNGDWSSGFSDLEKRFDYKNSPDHPIHSKFNFWDGSKISGKTLYLFSEQGLGDTIQYFRFIRPILNDGVDVTIGVQPELVTLLSDVFEDLTVISLTSPPPNTDYVSSLLSLPYLLKITSEHDISGVPYIQARNISKLEQKWLNLGTKFSVGLNWTGAAGHSEDYKRRINPIMFSNFETLNQIQFINLNFETQKLAPKVLDNAENLATISSDFSDTAAIANELDLIISVDTSLVHLAGSLGKPCWALIPFSSDWRWLTNRQDTPWYDSVRLFRQEKLGDWSNVFEDIKLELEKFNQSPSSNAKPS